MNTPCGVDFALDWLPGARAREIESGDDRLFALEMGQGPTVLLLHGYTCELTHFRFQLSALAAAGFRAVALDLPGHGHSNKPRGKYDASRFLAAARATLEALDAESAFVVGHSMGGAIAVALAAQTPERVQRVALISPLLPGFPVGATFGLWVNRIAPLPLLPRAILALQSRATFEQSNAAAVFDLSKVLAEDGGRWRDYPWQMFNVPGMRRSVAAIGSELTASWKRELPAIPKLHERALLLWGEQDQIVLHSGARAATDALGGKLISFEGCGHCAHFEKSDAVNAALVAHFRG